MQAATYAQGDLASRYNALSDALDEAIGHKWRQLHAWRAMACGKRYTPYRVGAALLAAEDKLILLALLGVRRQARQASRRPSGD